MDNLSAMPDASTGPIDQRFMRFLGRLEQSERETSPERESPSFRGGGRSFE